MQLGDDANFLEGRIAEARLWYEFAAGRGWAPAAMALAQTYDPFEIEKRGLVLAPDVEKARYWYRKARDLMNASVDFYLWRLELVAETARVATEARRAGADAPLRCRASGCLGR